ncbi:DUF2264 domain-containing protein [Streptomyces sp. NPDC004111]|uniref:DUF2264 domain-containing protein n=1 Tax=Streptomyces sp. NPDC004111 TaxID=3364690 RepID=UPI0036AE1833
MSTPPENRELSPYTGWTRAHWEHTADRLLLAVRPYATPRNGMIHLPGPRPSVSGPRSDGLEGYARTFLLAALRVAGARGDDPHGHLARYAEGLAAGTGHPTAQAGLSAADPESWPRTTDIRQAVVESASVALGLRLTRPWLWDTLDDAVRQRAVDWLLPALGPSPVNNNWWLFGLTVAGFLQDIGVETDRAAATIDTALARIEEWHLGEGWYSDGPNRSFDHYNAWALHFYPVLHAHLTASAEQEDPAAAHPAGGKALLDLYGPRLHDQLTTATRLFGADGAPMPYGRSLTYRFAAAAAPWLGALTGHTPLGPGATRRLASGTLRHFLDHGATDAEGLLTLGWHGPYAPIVQNYSGPGSPYWASKGFLGLLLPADHPVWTATEEPLPAETADRVTPVGPPNFLLQSTASDGLVRLHNHGSNHVGPEDDPGYARFAYSTRTGPAHETPDNHFSLLLDGRETSRGPAAPQGHGPDWAASAHTPAPGVRVLSATAAHDRTEVRAHLVTGAPADTPVRQTGWATAPGGPTAQLHPVHGYDLAVAELRCGPTQFGPDSDALALYGRTSADGASLFVALASLTADPDPAPVESLAHVQVRDADPHGTDIHVTWQNGTTTLLRLTPEEL